MTVIIYYDILYVDSATELVYIFLLFHMSVLAYYKVKTKSHYTEIGALI